MLFLGVFMVDIRKRKWIYVFFTFSSFAHGLIANRKFMKECAKEIGWRFVEEKDGHVNESGVRVYSLSLAPNKQCLVSPADLSKVFDKLTGFIVGVFVNNNIEHKFYRECAFIPGKKPEDFLLSDDLESVVLMRYRLMDRVELEKKFPELAVHLFKMTLEENFSHMDLGTSWLDRLKQGRDVYDRRAEAKKQLFDFFGIKVK